MKRIRGLDGIRMIAVAAVMASHFFESSTFINQLHLGHFGVMLFFILSGFLISSIILLQKNEKIRMGSFLKQFYIRRTLRIFPLFYLAILVFSIIGYGFGNGIWWHLTYTSNFLLINEGSGFLGTHFWSLAVEEQFYLVFPILIFACPVKWENALVIALITAGIACRYIFWNVEGMNTNFDRLLLTNLDCLALGAALALIKVREVSFKPFFLIGSGGIILSFICGNELTQIHSLLILFFTMVLAAIDQFQNARIIHLLEIKCIKYIGKISYGLYVWHYLLWQNKALFEPAYQKLNALTPILQYGHSERIVIGILSFAFAILSWEYFEKRILHLKSKFAYA